MFKAIHGRQGCPTITGMQVRSGEPDERQLSFGHVAGSLEQVFGGRDGTFVLAFEGMVDHKADMRRRKIRRNRERFAVTVDRGVVVARFHQQLSVAVEGVGFTGHEFDVALEGLLRRLEIAVAAMRITQHVPRGCEAGVDLERLFEMTDGLVELLRTDVKVAEPHVHTLVLAVEQLQLLQLLVLCVCIVLCGRQERLDDHLLTRTRGQHRGLGFAQALIEVLCGLGRRRPHQVRHRETRIQLGRLLEEFGRLRVLQRLETFAPLQVNLARFCRRRRHRHLAARIGRR